MVELFGNWRAHLAYFDLGVKQSLAYKKDFVMSLIFGFLAAVVMIFVWTAIYKTTNVAQIGGFTLLSMYAYFFIANATAAILDMDLDGTVQNVIYSGGVSIALLRPVRFVSQIFFGSLPGTIIGALVITLPLIAIGLLVMHASLTLLTVGLALAEFLIGFTIFNILFFVVGTLAVYTTNIWGASNLLYYTFQMLGGAFVPLNLFPAALQGLVRYSPFQFLAYAPTGTLLGIVPTGLAIQNIAVGLAWIVIVALFASLWWGRIKKKLSFVGG